MSGEPTPAPSRLRWFALAAALLLSLGLDCAGWRQVFVGGGRVNFVDGDCYSRLSRVSEVLAHPGRIIRWHTFENYPFGVRSHTTAPLDYLIAALSAILHPFVGLRSLDYAGAWISPLLGLLTLGGLAGSEKRPGAWLMGLVLAGSPILAQGFALGRPDHQSLLLLCLAAALAAEWAPSRGWGIVGGVSWALALWTSLYEPAVLLGLVLLARALFQREAFRGRLPGYGIGCALFAAALALERPQLVWPGANPYFAAWAQSIGELRSVPPWSPALYGWTGLAVLLAPALLWRRGPSGRGRLLVLAAVFALTCWQVRWGYFLALVYALTLPEQLAAIPRGWRGLAGVAFVLGLWPMAAEWRGRLVQPGAAALAQLAEEREDAALLRETAGFIALQSDDSPDAGILAPWWLSPALAYWSGQPALAGSSHESLPGTVDAARFYLAESGPAADAILRARRIRWVVAYEPERVFQTAAPLLGQAPTRHSLGAVLYDHPEAAPAGLRLALVNKYFKVYAVRHAAPF